jgi:hypothetical protein
VHGACGKCINILTALHQFELERHESGGKAVLFDWTPFTSPCMEKCNDWTD